MTDQESNSSEMPDLLSPPSATSAAVYKAIIAIGVSGEEEDVARFVALWIADAEARAHKIVFRLKIPVILLPLPEATDE